jgi:elongation factor P
MVTASQLRSGMAIRHENQSYKVLKADYHPGQGKMGGVTHAQLRNLQTGTVWEHSFRAELKLQDLPVEKHSADYLYNDGDQCVFMNPENYEQIEISKAMIGDRARFLQPEMRLTLEVVEGSPVSVLFPDMVEVRIADTTPPVHAQQDSTWKTATLENGAEVMVPQFIKTGDVIRLDVDTLRYADRVKGASSK